MKLEQKELEILRNTAKHAAIAAGNHIARVDRSNLKVDTKISGTSLASQVVTEVDRYCDQLIRDYLLESCNKYDLALLSEESAEQHNQQPKNRFTQAYFWCIDPLDGTLPFIQGKAGFAVSIALVSQTGIPVIGVAYDPVKDELFSAIKNGGAFKNDNPIPLPTFQEDNKNTLIVYADNSFKKQQNYPEAQKRLKKTALNFGASRHIEIYGNGAVKNAYNILGHPLACYFKQPKKEEGGGSLWDFTASTCIINEAGGWASNFAGEPLNLNPKHSTYMNGQGVIFATHKRLAESLLETF